MKLKHTLILTALAVALNTAFAVKAADEKPAKEEEAEKAQPAKTAMHHGHMEQNKQGTAGKADGACCRNSEKSDKQKPPHDHGEPHK